MLHAPCFLVSQAGSLRDTLPTPTPVQWQITRPSSVSVPETLNASCGSASLAQPSSGRVLCSQAQGTSGGGSRVRYLTPVYRAPCGGGAEKRNLLAPSPRCCMQRRATTAYRLPVPLGTPPLLNVWRLEPVKLPRARVTPHTGQPASHVSTQAWSARMAYRRSSDSAEARRPGKD